jgi:parvulin-like peptidyl-prolyl isomerase
MSNKTHSTWVGLMVAVTILAAALSGCIAKGDPQLGAPTSTVTPTATAGVAAATGNAATVGDQAIAMADFQTNVRFQRYQLIMQYSQYYQFYQQYPGDPFGLRSQLDQLSATLTNNAALGQQVLDHMIQDILVAKEAAKRGITVTDDELNKAYQGVFGFYPNGTPTPTITPTAITASTLNPTQLAIVTATPVQPVIPTETPGPTGTPDPAITPTIASTPYTLAGFQAVTANFYTNMASISITEPFIRGLLKAQLLGQKLSDAMSKDVAAVQDEVWARHILVADLATAQTVETRLKNGEDFAKVAADVSTDTGTKTNGGDLGWFAKGAMVAEFEAAAFAQPIGEVGQPVKTTYGYHIIQVLGHEVRPLSEADLTSAKAKVFSDWVTAAEKDPSVVKNDAWAQNVPNVPPFTPPNLDATPAPVTGPTTPPAAGSTPTP